MTPSQNSTAILRSFLEHLTPEERHDPPRDVQQEIAALLVCMLRGDAIVRTSFGESLTKLRLVRQRTVVNGKEIGELTRLSLVMFDSKETAEQHHYKKTMSIRLRELLTELADGEADSLLVFFGIDRLWDYELTKRMAAAILEGEQP